jgi:hypothetical protein
VRRCVTACRRQRRVKGIVTALLSRSNCNEAHYEHCCCVRPERGTPRSRSGTKSTEWSQQGYTAVSHLFLKTKHIVARLVCGCSMADASMLCAQSHRNLACAVNTRHRQKCICTLRYSAYYYDKQCTGADGALAPLVAATRCAHECMDWSVRGVTALTKAVVPLPVAEPASRQVPHALTSGKGGGGGPPPSQEGPLLARAQPEDSTPLQRALPPPLRRVERSSAVSTWLENQSPAWQLWGNQTVESEVTPSSKLHLQSSSRPPLTLLFPLTLIGLAVASTRVPI